MLLAVASYADGAAGADNSAVSMPGDHAAAVTAAATPPGPIFNVGLVLFARLAGFFSSFSVAFLLRQCPFSLLPFHQGILPRS